MALKIVTGGTTGAADGTLVSSGNPLVIAALNTAIDAHIRCDDGYWSADQSFDVPAELQVSFNGGSTWYGNGDEPITAPEIYAVNYPIKVRQTTAASSTSGSFVTNGTYTAIAALSTPTLTCTWVSTTQIDLSWTNVANEDASPGYTIERGTDGVSYSALTTKAANVTTHSDTGLAESTHYYYRVKAEGSGRYSDSGWGTDDQTTGPTLVAADDFTESSDTALASHTPTGTGAAGTWSKTAGSAGQDLTIMAATDRVRTKQTSSSGVTAACTHSIAWADGEVEGDFYIASKDGSQPYFRVRYNGSTGYLAYLLLNSTVQVGLMRNGSEVSGSPANVSPAVNVGDTVNLRIRAIGSNIKVYVNDVLVFDYTDGSPVTTSAGPRIEMYQVTGNSDSTGAHFDNFRSSTIP